PNAGLSKSFRPATKSFRSAVPLDLPSRLRHAKNEDAGTPSRRQNSDTPTPLVRWRSMICRHRVLVDSVALLMAGDHDAPAATKKGVVGWTLTIRPGYEGR